jgi:uncharacterized membrane protein YgcG
MNNFITLATLHGPFDRGEFLVVPLPQHPATPLGDGRVKVMVELVFCTPSDARTLTPYVTTEGLSRLTTDQHYRCLLDVHDRTAFERYLDWRVVNTLNGHCAHIFKSDSLRMQQGWLWAAGIPSIRAAHVRFQALSELRAAADAAVASAVASELPGAKRLRNGGGGRGGGGGSGGPAAGGGSSSAT